VGFAAPTLLFVLISIFDASLGKASPCFPFSLPRRPLVPFPREERIFGRLAGEGRVVGILVDNAGFGDYGPFAEAGWDRQYSMLRLNIAALMRITSLFLKPMRERGRGKILNLNSIAA
jgi:NAD(P)-dependent dehydrogenase (short-subunit alcohol dehydrogenase family)